MSQPFVHLIVPGALASPTGGYVYDRMVKEGLTALGHAVVVHEVPGALPGRGAEAERLLRAFCADLSPGQRVLCDGLALGDYPQAAEALARDHRLFALVHLPLAIDEAGALNERSRLYENERAALRFPERIIVTSPLTRRVLLERYGVAAGRVVVIPPGVTPRTFEPPPQTPGLRLLHIGSLLPIKGHELLLRAVARLPRGQVQLTCVGERGFDVDHAARLDALVASLHLSEEVTFVGGVPHDALVEHYAAADVLVSTSTYESFGMAAAEALSSGLPVVATRVGALAETLGDAGVRWVAPSDEEALARALRDLVETPAEVERLRAQARRHGRRFLSWERVSELYQEVLA